MALQNTPFAGRQMELSSWLLCVRRRPARAAACYFGTWPHSKFKTGPDSVDHYDLSRLIDVLVTPVGNDLGRVAKDIEQTLATVRCPKT